MADMGKYKKKLLFCVVYFDPYTIIYTDEAQTIKMGKDDWTREEKEKKNTKI